MAVKTALRDLQRGISPVAFEWFRSHARIASDWDHGTGILWGHSCYDPQGKTYAMGITTGSREFGSFLLSAYNEDKGALVAACNVVYIGRKECLAQTGVVNAVISWGFGRPYGMHTQFWAEAVRDGLFADRTDAKRNMRGLAGIDGWEVGKDEQDVLRLAYKHFLLAGMSEAQRFEHRRSAEKAAIEAAMKLRQQQIARRKAARGIA